MFIDKDDNSGFQWLFVGTPLALGAVLILAISNPPKQTPVANSEVAFGCYVNDRAPAILLSANGMHILQPNFPIIPFHLEKHKNGYSLTADRPIKAEAQGRRFTYAFYRPGDGTYLNFFHIVAGVKYGAFEKEDLDGFTMVARDGTGLSYAAASKKACTPGLR